MRFTGTHADRFGVAWTAARSLHGHHPRWHPLDLARRHAAGRRHPPSRRRSGSRSDGPHRTGTSRLSPPSPSPELAIRRPRVGSADDQTRPSSGPPCTGTASRGTGVGTRTPPRSAWCRSRTPTGTTSPARPTSEVPCIGNTLSQCCRGQRCQRQEPDVRRRHRQHTVAGGRLLPCSRFFCRRP